MSQSDSRRTREARPQPHRTRTQPEAVTVGNHTGDPYVVDSATQER